MNTFLPYADFAKSAAVLDYKRLGKQRVEAWQIINALRNPAYGWQRHPAMRMWRGYVDALAWYGHAITIEWCERGYQDTMLQRFVVLLKPIKSISMPPWFGDKKFHRSHRRMLLHKDFMFYGNQFSDTATLLRYAPRYVWPA